MDMTMFSSRGNGPVALVQRINTQPIDVYEITTRPISDGVVFSDADLDQLSAILTDFIAQSQSNIAHFRNIPSNPGASDLTQKWIERAADLRDRIEAR